MKKIKVLQFPIANARGGITQYALENWKFIDKERFQFDFATRSKTLDFAKDLISQGCKIHYISCSSEENEEQFIKELDQIMDEGYDAIHLHTSYWKGYLAEKIATERRCPIVIIHAHSSMVEIADEEQRLKSIITHNFYKNSLPTHYATHFCACSRTAAEWLYGKQIPRNQIYILRNAIDLSKYSFSCKTRELIRNQLGLSNSLIIGHVGRFTYSKNHLFLLEVFSAIHKKIPHAKLMLVGVGELQEAVKHKVKKLGLEHAVLFMGKRSDVPQLMQAMDIFLFPSHFEGLGLALVEAQAAGLKCLASTNVPEEAQITPNLELLPLTVQLWVERVLQLAEGYERTNLNDLFKQSGYDLKTQIKVIEKLYAGEDISRDCETVAGK